MSSFDDRQKAYEAKFIKDEEKLFKIRARRRKFLGLWAAEQMHKNEEQCLEYALEIVKFGVGKRTTQEIAEKVMKDMQAAGVKVTLKEIEDKLEQLTEKAAHSLEKEGVI